MLTRFPNSSSSFLLLFSIAILLTTGCYLDYPEHAGSAEVQGTVTIDSLPVDRAKVVFIPNRTERPSARLIPIAYGITDAAGKFTLQTADGEKEIAACDYTVLISKTEIERDAEGNLLMPWNKNLLPESVKSSALFQHTNEVIPAFYNRESVLKFTVVPSPKILRPEFKLSFVDPLIAPKED
jgi:hypothetical protein